MITVSHLTHTTPRLGIAGTGRFFRSLKAPSYMSMPTDRSEWTGEEIRGLRKRLGMSQGEFAELVGLPTYDGSSPRLSDIENGRRDPSGPLCKLLSRIADEGE